MLVLSTLTPTQAAVVAAVTTSEVNRALDENLLPEPLSIFAPDRSRRLYPDACVWIAFYFKTADRLTVAQRRRVIALAVERALQNPHWRDLWNDFPPYIDTIPGDWMICEDFLTIDLAPYIAETRERVRDLVTAHNRVVSDPEILSGTPVISGTRIPVHDVAASLAAGVPIVRIQSAYPKLATEDIHLAALYAKANPIACRPQTSN